MRSLLIAAAAAACLLVPSPVDAAVHAAVDQRQGDQPKCLASAKKVATKKLHTARGGYFGTLVITVSTQQQGDFSYVVCASTKVAKKYRLHSNIVRQEFSEFAQDGDHLGELRHDAYASKTGHLQFASSFVPDGHHYVFHVQIEAGRGASGKLTYRVPA